MVRVKGVTGTKECHQCETDCRLILQDSDGKCCCYRVCDAICVKIECGCQETDTQIKWDCDTQSYHDTLFCGNLSIDVEFTIKKCPDGSCKMCLESSCMSYDGQCEDQSCLGITPGCVFCDDYHITPGNGIKWEGVPLSSCAADTTDCTSGDITVECASREFCPAGCGCDQTCKGCDCVCPDLCFSYVDDDCDGGTSKVSWNSVNKSWTVSFPCDSDSGNDVDFTITFEPDPVDKCCQLKLASSRGTVLTPLVDTTCPYVDAAWLIDVYGDGSVIGEATAVCAECGDSCGGSFVCCDNLIPTTLTGTFEPDPDLPSGARCDCAAGSFTLTYDATDDWWIATGVTFGTCGQTVTVRVYCKSTGTSSQDFGLDLVDWSGGCDIDRTDVVTPNPGASCDPLNLVYDHTTTTSCCAGDPGNFRLTITE